MKKDEKKKTTTKTVTKNKKENKIEISVDTLKNVVIVILVIVVIFGVSYMASSDSKDYAKQSEAGTTDTSSSAESASSKIQEESDAISEDEQAEIDDIDVSEYLDLMDQSEPSAIYVARPTCHYCQIQGPIMKNIVYKNEDAPIYYLNTDEFEDNDQSDFMASDDAFKEGFGTPMVLIVKDGKVADKVEGLTSGEDLNTLLKNNGIIG